jgi:hypothetical protein
MPQPQGWIGPTVAPNMPKLTNLRHDPFERMNWPANGFSLGSIAYYDSFKHEMRRFQIPAQFIPKYASSFIEFTPMQAGASFNVNDIKEKIKQAQDAAAEHQD